MNSGDSDISQVEYAGDDDGRDYFCQTKCLHQQYYFTQSKPRQLSKVSLSNTNYQVSLPKSLPQPINDPSDTKGIILCLHMMKTIYC